MQSAILSALVLTGLLIRGVGGSAQEPVERETRVFDVSFLTADIPQFPHGGEFRVSEYRAPELALREPDDYPDAGGVFFDAGEDAEMPAGAGIDPESLVELISANVAEDSWENTKNTISASASHLVVTQTPEVLDDIEQLLAALRARRARMVTVDIALVPIAALGELASGDELHVDSERFDSIVAAAGTQAKRATLTAYNDQIMSAFDGKVRVTIGDEEINSTGVLPVVNPVIRRLRLGLLVELRALVLEESGAVALWLGVERNAQLGEARRATFFSELELLELSRQRFEGHVLVEPARAAIAGIFRDSDPDFGLREFAIVVRARALDVSAEPPERSAPDADAFVLRSHDLRFLEGEDFELLLEMLTQNVDPSAWRDERAEVGFDRGLLFVRARPATQAQVRAWVRERVERAGRPLRTELRVYEGDLTSTLAIQSAAGADGALETNWREGEAARALQELHRSVSWGILGRRTEASAIRVRSYVADLETVSGGTGFSIEEMPDPIMTDLSDGFALSVSARELLGERLFADLELARASTGFRDPVSFVAPIRLVAQGPPAAAAAGDKPEIPRRTVLVPYAIDLPRESKLATDLEDHLPAGRDVLLSVRGSPGGKATIVVANVRIGSSEEGGR